LELVNVEIINVPERDSNKTFMAAIAETADRKYRYAMPYDRFTYAPLGTVISKSVRRRRFFIFGPYKWVIVHPVHLFSQEGSDVRRFFSRHVPQMQRELDEYAYNVLCDMLPTATIIQPNMREGTFSVNR
jgi:hypothetical protein